MQKFRNYRLFEKMLQCLPKSQPEIIVEKKLLIKGKKIIMTSSL